MKTQNKIAIVGAGQAGLQLGLSLLKNNYTVTIYSEYTPENILNTPAPGTSVMFDDALRIERSLGIDFWQNIAPQIQKFHFSVCLPNGKRLMYNNQKSHQPFQAIDQRIKFSIWMHKFTENGGQLVFGKVDTDALEQIASENDAVFVATGKGALSQLFETNSTQTIFDKPQRNLLVLIAKNQKVGANFQMDAMNVNIFPVGGEVFIVPYLDKNNEHTISILFEPQPDGPMDFFKHLKTGDELLIAAKEAFRKFMPWIADSFQDLVLIDSQSYAKGAIRPLVRKPYGYLPSGKIVFGLGDTVMINDPAAAQGANTACRMAYHYYQQIIENQSGIFDEAWATYTFDRFWETTGKYAHQVSNEFLKLKDYQIDATIGFCKNNTMLLNLTEGISSPKKLYEWFDSPKNVSKKLAANGISKFTVMKGKLYLLFNIISYMIGSKLRSISAQPS